MKGYQGYYHVLFGPYLHTQHMITAIRSWVVLHLERVLSPYICDLHDQDLKAQTWLEGHPV